MNTHRSAIGLSFFKFLPLAGRTFKFVNQADYGSAITGAVLELENISQIKLSTGR